MTLLLTSSARSAHFPSGIIAEPTCAAISSVIGKYMSTQPTRRGAESPAVRMTLNSELSASRFQANNPPTSTATGITS